MSHKKELSRPLKQLTLKTKLWFWLWRSQHSFVQPVSSYFTIVLSVNCQQALKWFHGTWMNNIAVLSQLSLQGAVMEAACNQQCTQVWNTPSLVWKSHFQSKSIRQQWVQSWHVQAVTTATFQNNRLHPKVLLSGCSLCNTLCNVRRLCLPSSIAQTVLLHIRLIEIPSASVERSVRREGKPSVWTIWRGTVCTKCIHQQEPCFFDEGQESLITKNKMFQREYNRCAKGSTPKSKTSVQLQSWCTEKTKRHT